MHELNNFCNYALIGLKLSVWPVFVRLLEVAFVDQISWANASKFLIIFCLLIIRNNWSKYFGVFNWIIYNLT